MCDIKTTQIPEYTGIFFCYEISQQYQKNYEIAS